MCLWAFIKKREKERERNLNILKDVLLTLKKGKYSDPFCAYAACVSNKFIFFLPSNITSRNHSTIAEEVKIKPKINKAPPFSNPWKYITAETVTVNKAKLVTIGQGEGSTKW